VSQDLCYQLWLKKEPDMITDNWYKYFQMYAENWGPLYCEVQDEMYPKKLTNAGCTSEDGEAMEFRKFLEYI